MYCSNKKKCNYHQKRPDKSCKNPVNEADNKRFTTHNTIPSNSNVNKTVYTMIRECGSLAPRKNKQHFTISTYLHWN